MRSLTELMEEVRFNTNKVNSTRFTDAALIRFFDSAQRQIQTIIFNAYPQDAIFSKEKLIDVTSSVSTYTLPSDMLTPNSVYAVIPIRSNSTYADPLRRLSPSERSKDYGYVLKGNQIEIVPQSIVAQLSYKQIFIHYCPILPRLTQATDVSKLPTICEEYMTMFVERKINYVDSSKDIQNSNVFTAEEKTSIAQLFADAARDVKPVTIGNSDYINY